MAGSGSDVLTLESVRNNLIRQEDTIIFSLIDRAKYPLNPQLYDSRCSLFPWISGSVLECIVKETEAIQAKVIFLWLIFFYFDSYFDVRKSIIRDPFEFLIFLIC